MRLTKKAMAALLRLDGAVAMERAHRSEPVQHYVLLDGVLYYDHGPIPGRTNVYHGGDAWFRSVQTPPNREVFKPIPLIKVHTQLLRDAYQRIKDEPTKAL